MRLKQRRKQQEMSQQTVADKVGITREYLARLEAGVHDPTLSVVRRLAKVLKVNVAELVK